MLIVISPAKTLDYATPVKTRQYSQPDFLGDSRQLVETMRAYSPDGISSLMKVSRGIGELNHARYLNWHAPFSPDNARQAVFAFKGDVYTGLDIHAFKAADLKYAQNHLRILSGLYGVLKPLDLIQPYRLEMGTRLPNPRGANLYEYWSEKATEAVRQAVAAQKDEVLINLASAEYFKVLRPGKLDVRVVTPVFKDYKNGACKVISFYAKKARGRMTAWLLRERVKSVAGLEGFAEDGYRFNAQLSKPDEPVFTRKQE